MGVYWLGHQWAAHRVPSHPSAKESTTRVASFSSGLACSKPGDFKRHSWLVEALMCDDGGLLAHAGAIRGQAKGSGASGAPETAARLGKVREPRTREGLAFLGEEQHHVLVRRHLRRGAYRLELGARLILRAKGEV